MRVRATSGRGLQCCRYVCGWRAAAGCEGDYSRQMAAGVDNTLGYTATHYFSSEASSRVVTDRPGEVVVVNVKIAWAESGAQSLMEGTHISGDWARACAARRKPCLFFLCAQNAEAACGLDSNPRETSYDAALDKRRFKVQPAQAELYGSPVEREPHGARRH